MPFTKLSLTLLFGGAMAMTGCAAEANTLIFRAHAPLGEADGLAGLVIEYSDGGEDWRTVTSAEFTETNSSLPGTPPVPVGRGADLQIRAKMMRDGQMIAAGGSGWVLSAPACDYVMDIYRTEEWRARLEAVGASEVCRAGGFAAHLLRDFEDLPGGSLVGILTGTPRGSGLTN